MKKLVRNISTVTTKRMQIFKREILIIILCIALGNAYTLCADSIYQNNVEITNDELKNEPSAHPYPLSTRDFEPSSGTWVFSGFCAFLLIVSVVVWYRLQNLEKRLRTLAYTSRNDRVSIASNLSRQGIKKENATASSSNQELSKFDAGWLSKVEEISIRQLENSFFNPGVLANELAICERQLQRKMKSLMGMTPGEYLRKLRLEKGKELLESGKYDSISQVAQRAGFKCPQHFAKIFRSTYGISPRDIMYS